jgi:hypothetical protein
MQERIKGFDGVRAIAVVLVNINHKVALPGTDLGNLRIRIFFALSGFLIIGILARRRECIEAGNSTIGAEIRTFYWRRSLRIFPLYYTVLTIFGVLHVLGYFYDHEAGIPSRFCGIWDDSHPPCGIEHLKDEVHVSGRGKRSIEDHFDTLPRASSSASISDDLACRSPY